MHLERSNAQPPPKNVTTKRHAQLFINDSPHLPLRESKSFCDLSQTRYLIEVFFDIAPYLENRRSKLRPGLRVRHPRQGLDNRDAPCFKIGNVPEFLVSDFTQLWPHILTVALTPQRCQCLAHAAKGFSQNDGGSTS